MGKSNKELAVEMMCAFLKAIYSRDGAIPSFTTLQIEERIQYLYDAVAKLDD